MCLNALFEMEIISWTEITVNIENPYIIQLHSLWKFGGFFLGSQRKLSFHVSNNKIIIGRKSKGYRKYQVNSTAGDENVSHSISVPA